MVKMTVAVAAVLMVMRDGNEHYGQALIRATGFDGGTLYPILARLRVAGLLESRQEEVASRQEIGGRRPRRYFKLTAAGAELVPQAFAKLRSSAVATSRVLSGS
jgi:DNA-binding PadR family transcriptional regulator